MAIKPNATNTFTPGPKPTFTSRCHAVLQLPEADIRSPRNIPREPMTAQRTFLPFAALAKKIDCFR
jgi:hypothetical protein